MDRVITIRVFRRCLDKHTASKSRFLKPFSQGIEYDEELLLWISCQCLNPALKPIAELFVAQTQGRKDQVFLCAKMFVNGEYRKMMMNEAEIKETSEGVLQFVAEN